MNKKAVKKHEYKEKYKHLLYQKKFLDGVFTAIINRNPLTIARGNPHAALHIITRVEVTQHSVAKAPGEAAIDNPASPGSQIWRCTLRPWIITAEEHSVVGGLGSAVSEFLSENQPTKVVKIGVQDQFGQSGNPELLKEHYGLTAKNIVEKAVALTK